MKIPKIIHYCWFGPKPIPELELRCIETWKKNLPDYEFMFWNEKTFDIKNSNDYVREAYENKMYSFVSDYVRVECLVEFGGVYLDTDIELLSSVDIFLNNEAFTGFETKRSIAAGIMGAKKGSIVFKQMQDYYRGVKFSTSYNEVNLTTIGSVMTKILDKYGLEHTNKDQSLSVIHIYERDVFYPKKNKDGNYILSKNSVSIHFGSGSWLTPRQKRRGENLIWRNLFRPILRKLKFLIIKTIGEKKSILFENKIRNWLK